MHVIDIKGDGKGRLKARLIAAKREIGRHEIIVCNIKPKRIISQI